MKTTIRHYSEKFSRNKIKYILSTVCVIAIIDYFGLHCHLLEKDFSSQFDYPLSEDITGYIEQMKNNEKPSLPPINSYNYSFVYSCNQKCLAGSSDVRLLIIVKSSLHNFERRTAIRNTWGFENRFSDVAIRTIFLLGLSSDSNLQNMIQLESSKYGDLVQADFHDTYFNNTIKTMMGFKWAMKFCPKAKFYMFSDDDMYISIKNVLRFVRNPSHYPEYVEESLTALRKLAHSGRMLKQKPDSKSISSNFSDVDHVNSKRVRRQVQNYELPDDALLYAGFVFNSSPHRHKSSKWFISLTEYPFDRWPPYVSAGAYILSREVLITMYYASFYTKHFRFDDIYLSLLAKKCGIEPFHCKEFYFYKKDYNSHNYRYVVASHGFHHPNELIEVWNQQRAAGNA